MLLNWGLDTPRTGRLYEGMSLSEKREHITDTCNNMVSLRCVMKEARLRYIYLIPLTWRLEKAKLWRRSDCWALRAGEGFDYKGMSTGKVFLQLFCILNGVVFTCLNAFTNTCKTVTERVDFTVNFIC